MNTQIAITLIVCLYAVAAIVGWIGGRIHSIIVDGKVTHIAVIIGNVLCVLGLYALAQRFDMYAAMHE